MKSNPILRVAMLIAILVGSFSVASAGAQTLSEINVHGFASQGYLSSSDHNYLANSHDGSSEYQEFAFNLSSNIADDLRVGVQFFARDLGPLGNNAVELDWAFGDYHWKDEIGFRAGRFKMPYGFYNETADFDGVRTSVLLPQSVYDLRLRDLLVAVNGAQAYGSIDAQSLGFFDYSAYYGSIQVPETGSVSRFFNDNLLPDGSGVFAFDRLENDFTTGGAIVWNTPVEGLRLGQSLTHYEATMDVTLGNSFMIGVMGLPNDPATLAATAPQGFTMKNVNLRVSSVEYSYQDFVFASEYARWTGDFDNAIVGTSINWEKWYASGSYRVNDWFEFGSYYSVHYDDKDNRSGDGLPVPHSAYQKDLALSTRFDISTAMIFKLEAHFMDGTAQLLNQANPDFLSATGPQDIEDKWTMFTAKTSFVF